MIQQVSHYKIKDFLGQGAMGVVYSAHDGKFLREVAVKLLRTDPFLPPAEQEKQRKALKRFEREAKVVASLQHYAIVPVYDFGQATVQGQDYPFMVMRLMGGGSLEKRLEQGALPPAEVVRIISWLAPALDKVHQQDIVHRDLKPANILFDEDDLPALADFGIAKLTQATQITHSQAIPGTPAYMSPEQTYRKAHRKEKLDGRSDIYSLGAIIYEMLTGKRPYHEAMDPLQVMYCHRNEPVPRLDELRTDLGAGWQAVIDKAMAKKPDERYATAGELAAALKALSSTPRTPVVTLPTAATHLEAGNQYYQQREYDSAIAEYSRALLLDVNFSYGYLNRAVTYHIKGQFDKAIPDYNQAIRLNANDPKGYNYRGLAYYNMGQLVDAIGDYDHALRLKPDYTEATNNRQAAYQALTARGQASYQKGQRRSAIADYTKLLRLNPRDASVLVLRGQAYEKQGQSQQAIADYDEALRINPNHAAAKKSRANMIDETLIKDEARLKKLPPKQRVATYVALFKNESLLSSLPPKRRAAIGVDLAKLGDPRKEIMTVEGMLFCYVPPGPFWMGSNDGDNDNKAQHQLDIPYGYWISRDLISNAQFQQFVKAGGYKREKYWVEAKAAGVWKMAGIFNKSGQVKDWWDDNWRTAPNDHGEPFNLPNHPVVGVMWYEALAFTRWLTERLGSQMGLPSEAEWEKAARGGLLIPATPLIRPAIARGRGGEGARGRNSNSKGNDYSAFSVPRGLSLRNNPLPQRRYPWGDDVEAGYINSEEAGIGKTSALGVFPQDKSPYGTQEMGGNVWEWTRSLYQPYPYQLNDKREQLDAPIDKRRILRACASFYTSNIEAGCSLRSRNYPYDWYVNYGFRVLWSPIPLTSGPSGLSGL